MTKYFDQPFPDYCETEFNWLSPQDWENKDIVVKVAFITYLSWQYSACSYPVHIKCLTLVPPNCPKQEIRDPNSKKAISRSSMLHTMNDFVVSRYISVTSNFCSGSYEKGSGGQGQKILTEKLPKFICWFVRHLYQANHNDQAVKQSIGWFTIYQLEIETKPSNSVFVIRIKSNSFQRNKIIRTRIYRLLHWNWKNDL